ncbi:hypothetical protein K440DRAFT_610578 [Wilcoxina mikolae CBS 423.85]|nr:hypothetical protein K440DRAFT_610578 [Wilcoxina mikolae CBS 423.85]
MISTLSIPQVFFVLSLFFLSCTEATTGNFTKADNKYQDIIITPSTIFIGEPNLITWNLTTNKTISLDLLSEDYNNTIAHIAVDITNVESFYWTPDDSLKEGVYAIRMFEGRESVAATEIFNLSRRKASTSTDTTPAKSSATPASTAAASAAKSQAVGNQGVSTAALGGAVAGAFVGGLIIGLLVMVIVRSKRKQPEQSEAPVLGTDDGLALKPYDGVEVDGREYPRVEVYGREYPGAELDPDAQYRPEMQVVDERLTDSISSRGTMV